MDLPFRGQLLVSDGDGRKMGNARVAAGILSIPVKHRPWHGAG